MVGATAAPSRSRPRSIRNRYESATGRIARASRGQERKDDTRRKILAGAAVLARSEHDEAASVELWACAKANS